MRCGVALLAGLLLAAASSPAWATSSSVVIGYYQGFPLQVEAAAGGLCLVGGVPTPDGLTAPSSGLTTIAYTPNTGVHTLPVNASEGFTAVDALVSPSEHLRLDTDDGISLNFNASSAPVGTVASVTIYLQNSTTNDFNCSATFTFTVVEASSCTTPPPPSSIVPYPPDVVVVQNPEVDVTIINQVIQIVQVQINVIVQVTTNNYNSFTCTCCFNSCNNFVIVVPPPAPPLPANITAPPPVTASPPVSAPPPTESAPPPESSPSPPPPPPLVPAPAPSEAEGEGSEGSGSS